jgi:hypothetical protein
MFSQITTEYLVESDDGDYSKMVCSTELDQSHETTLAKVAKKEGKAVWWQSDFSQIKAMERDYIQPMKHIDFQKAQVLLLPLFGAC